MQEPLQGSIGIKGGSYGNPPTNVVVTESGVSQEEVAKELNGNHCGKCWIV